MALTSARQILNKKILGGGDVQELEVEVTALSASVLTIGEKLENVTEASTTERIVGKWIDGSDVYEKTITSTTPNSDQSAAIVDITSLNIKDVISMNYMCKATFAENNITETFETADSIILWIRLVQPDNTQSIACQVKSAAYQDMPIYITIRYTKTAAESSKKRTTKKK